MSLSSYIINNMNIIELLKYLKRANNSIALVLNNPLSHSIRMNHAIKSRTIKVVENIMELRNTLETLDDEYQLITQSILQADMTQSERDDALFNEMKRVGISFKELKEKLINLLDNDFENRFVKKLRLDLNDFIRPNFLVDYAEIKLNELDHTGPDILLQALMAKNLANKANKMRNMIDSIDPNIIDRTTLDVYHIRQHEEMIKKYIAQSSAILHDLDDKRLSSINKAGQIIKRRVRNTKRRNINSRSRNKRNNRSSRRTR